MNKQGSHRLLTIRTIQAALTCAFSKPHSNHTGAANGGADAFALAEIFGWSDVRMALRYTHATDESKRRAVENLAQPLGPSDESVTNEKGRIAALP